MIPLRLNINESRIKKSTSLSICVSSVFSCARVFVKTLSSGAVADEIDSETDLLDADRLFRATSVGG